MSAKIGKGKRRAAKDKEQLGEWVSVAARRLLRMVMFRLLQESGQHFCYRCGEPIKLMENLSIEHKIPWRDAENPKELFFDLDNVAFSHRTCNTQQARTHTEARLKAWQEQAKAHPAFRNRDTGEVIPAGRNVERLARERGLHANSLRRLMKSECIQYRSWILA